MAELRLRLWVTVIIIFLVMANAKLYKTVSLIFLFFYFWTGIKKWLFLISCWNTVCIITVCLVVMSNSQSLVSFTIISKCLSYGFQISNDLIFICLCKIQWKRIPLSFYSKIFVKITFMLIITCLARTKEN